MIDLLTAFGSTHFVPGVDARTREPVAVPLAHFEKGLSAAVPTGGGKTDTMAELLRSQSLGPRPWLYCDYAGTGFDAAARFDAVVATVLRFGIEEAFPDLPETENLADRFSLRHAYVTVGEDDPPIRINLLRRLRDRDGRRETPQRVAGRFADVWATQYEDVAIRVRFTKFATVVAGLLAAADRPLPEYARIFESEEYRQFLRREHERLATMDDPFVRLQWEILDTQFLNLRKQPGDGVSTRQFEEISSLHNSLSALRAGPMATFFGGNENFSLEDVVYGGKRLYVSVRALANREHRKFVLRALFAAVEGLVVRIPHDDPAAVGFLIFDELGQLSEMHMDAFAQLRNHRFSPVILRQTYEAQLVLLGFPAAAAAVIEQCTRYHIFGRVESEALARKVASAGPPIDYEEVVLRMLTHTHGWSEADAWSAGRAWTETFDGDVRANAGTSGTITMSGSTTEQRMRVPIDEVLLHRTLETLHLPNYHLVHIYDGMSRTVRHYQARQLPRQLFGRDYVAAYLGRNRRLHDRHAAPFVPFDPTIRVVTAAASDTTPPGAPEPYQPVRRARGGTSA